MLPERLMAEPGELRRWIARAFKAAAALPEKVTHADRESAVAKTRPPLKKATGRRRRHPIKDARVDAYIDALPIWQQAACQKVRDLVHAADVEVVETIKRTKLPFFVLQGNICALLAAKDHVNVFLYDGAIVPDPEGIITGGHDNKTARTVSIRQGDVLNARAFTSMIKHIIANNRSGGWRRLKTVRKRPPRAR
jgi:hypothetical protein